MPAITRLKYLKTALIALVVVFILMQLVRFVVPEFGLSNPPVTHTVQWQSAEAQQLWQQTCADCHSNETVYPWYAYIAPVGWLVAHDTNEGRRELNVSENGRVEWDEMMEVIDEGEMPPAAYLITHPEAKLSEADQQVLMDGIYQTFGSN